jgi:hypothetical protein
VRLLLLLAIPVFLRAQPAKLPSFEQFHVSKVFTGPPAHPHLTTSFSGNFRSAIRDAAKRGPNFAGKFAIARWGCGSSCIQMAVINQQTGAVYRGPFEKLDFSAPRRFEEEGSQPNSFEPLGFRKESRLLVVHGCPEEVQSDCAAFFYEWNGKKFRLLQKLPVAPAPVF